MFFPSSKVIVQHPFHPNQILLVRRYVGEKIYYEPAGGKLEIDFSKRIAENLEECAIREVQEELGLTVGLDGYLGSYYFFWSIAPEKCSSCAVFLGKVLDEDMNFIANADSCELKIEPAWVAVEDVLAKKITIDPSYVGLEDIVMNYCRQIR